MKEELKSGNHGVLSGELVEKLEEANISTKHSLGYWQKTKHQSPDFLPFFITCLIVSV